VEALGGFDGSEPIVILDRLHRGRAWSFRRGGRLWRLLWSRLSRTGWVGTGRRFGRGRWGRRKSRLVLVKTLGGLDGGEPIVILDRLCRRRWWGFRRGRGLRSRGGGISNRGRHSRGGGISSRGRYSRGDGGRRRNGLALVKALGGLDGGEPIVFFLSLGRGTCAYGKLGLGSHDRGQLGSSSRRNRRLVLVFSLGCIDRGQPLALVIVFALGRDRSFLFERGSTRPVRFERRWARRGCVQFGPSCGATGLVLAIAGKELLLRFGLRPSSRSRRWFRLHFESGHTDQGRKLGPGSALVCFGRGLC
jgi:hypothetical protein